MSYTYTGAASVGSEDATNQFSITGNGWNYTDGWTVSKNTPSEAILACTTGNLDAVPTLRFARSLVGNVYSGSGTTRTSTAVSTRGFSVVAQYNDFFVCEDAAAIPSRIYLPISAHIVIKLPESLPSTPQVADYANHMVNRLVATMTEQGATQPGGRLNSLIRGNLLPTALR